MSVVQLTADLQKVDLQKIADLQLTVDLQSFAEVQLTVAVHSFVDLQKIVVVQKTVQCPVEVQSFASEKVVHYYSFMRNVFY